MDDLDLYSVFVISHDKLLSIELHFMTGKTILDHYELEKQLSENIIEELPWIPPQSVLDDEPSEFDPRIHSQFGM